MNPLRSVGARLAFGLFLAVAVALAMVYLILVPSLERRLVNSKLAQLEQSAKALQKAVVDSRFHRWDRFANREAPQANARIVFYTVEQRRPRTVLRNVADSGPGRSDDLTDNPIAHRAAGSLVERGTTKRGGTRFAEVAVQIRADDAILLLSAPLSDQLGTVELVERRLVVAGLLALIVAVLLGYGASSLFARRIRRLERAAERIARGQFDEPVVDSGGDEVAELASAFERMRQRLAQLDHARREFIANASHELRTPLFSLSGFLELLDEEDLDDETRQQFVSTMREQIERLTRLATDLLDLSRLDAGRMRVVSQRVELAAVASTVATEFCPIARAEGRELEIVGSDGATALADEQRVTQIGRILVENALLHTPPGTTVRLRAGSRDGRALLEVEDDGPGIPEEHIQHLFERFYRAEGVVASGSGLGLAIARELAEVMGGSITLRSQPGRTVFSVELPSAEPEEPFSRENEDAALAAR